MNLYKLSTFICHWNPGLFTSWKNETFVAAAQASLRDAWAMTLVVIQLTLDFCRWKFKMIYYSLCGNVFGMCMQRLYGVWTNHEPMHQVFMTPNDSKWVAFFAATKNGGHENLGSQSDNLRCKFQCFLLCYSKKSDGNDPGTHFGGDFLGPQVLNLPSCSQTEAMDAEGFSCLKVFATLNKHIAARQYLQNCCTTL